jgi:hypothetical protein
MTINQIIGNNERTSKVDTELWKKMNEKYSTKENKIPTKKIYKTNLEQQIDYTEGKLTINLEIFENIAVNPKTQKEYDTLMQIYDSADWKFSNKKTINKNLMASFGKKTCIITEEAYFISKKILKYGYTRQCPDKEIISFEEFCIMQNITQEIINDISPYYDKNYPNRRSKG